MMTHSFTFKFIFSCGLISTIVLLITTYFTYQISIAEMEKLLGERLSSIAINTQSEINIEDHETLFYYFLAQKKELSSTTEFKKLQKTLQEIKRRNNLKSHIYTMVLDPSFPTRAIFMGMSNKKSYTGNSVARNEWMTKVWKTGKTFSTPPYSDSEGQWISSITPLKNRDNEIVALYELDYNIDSEVATIKAAYLKRLILPILLGILLIIFVGLLIGKQIVRKIKILSDFTDSIRKGDYGVSILDNEDDELHQLRDNFNLLCRELTSNEKKITKLNIDLVRSSSLSVIGEMSANVSHEVNNPAAVINLVISKLKKLTQKGDCDKEIFLKELTTIEKMILRISRITNSLRKSSHDSTNEKKTMLNIKDLIQESIILCESRLTQESIELIIDKSCDETMIFAKEVQLSQVLLNIINNAIYALKDLDEKWIKITCEEEGNNIKITITDSGLGIPDEVIDKLFEAFFTTKDVTEGTGLGMNIVKNIIESHDGLIYVNTECRNTQFVIVLPKQS